jgi:hypothetical protein
MSKWSLTALLAGLHDDIQGQLARSRELMGHPVSKGDVSEKIWRELLCAYLPKRYQVEKATVVDSNGAFSEQIDIVVFDRQYSPLVFQMHDELIVPAEAVYAVFEAKQAVNADIIKYARKKAASVRALHRTSLPIPSAGGELKAKEPAHILAGVLTFESDWRPALGDSLVEHLAKGDDNDNDFLDLGCVAAHGLFLRAPNRSIGISADGKPATAFLLEFIARLQDVATVPRMDVRAYAAWLSE